MDCSTPGFPVPHHLLELAQTHVHWFGDAIQPSHPLSPPSPPAFNLSQHQGLSNELALHIRWPKYWSFSFSICPSNEYSGLISFRMDWFDLLEVQQTLKSLLQHHSSKASILWCSASFIVQVSHPTGKTYSIFSNNLSYPPHLSLHSAHQAAKEYYFPHFPVAKYNHSTDVVVAVTASKDIQVLIPGTCESSLCGNRLLANVVELRISRWRDYSGLWGDSQRQSQMSLWNRDQEVWHTEEKKVMWPYRWKWGWRNPSPGTQPATRSWKMQGNSPKSLQKECSHLGILISAQRDQERTVRVYTSLVLSHYIWVICYNSYR